MTKFKILEVSKIRKKEGLEEFAVMIVASGVGREGVYRWKRPIEEYDYLVFDACIYAIAFT